MREFIIIGNSRVGSTWLATALGGVGGLSVDYELKATGHAVHSHHLEVSSIADIHLALSSVQERSVERPVAVGVKLVFDPVTNCSDSSAVDLLKIVAEYSSEAPETRWIHLTRPYCEGTSSGTGFTMKPGDSGSTQLMSQAAASTPHRSKSDALPSHVCDPNLLAQRVLIDQYLVAILSATQGYTRIGYEEIPSQFGSIASSMANRVVDLSIADVEFTQKNARELRPCSLGVAADQYFASFVQDPQQCEIGTMSLETLANLRHLLPHPPTFVSRIRHWIFG